VTKVKIRDECVGGSAFNAPKSPRKGHPILNSFRDMFRGSSKKSSPKPSKSVKQQLQNNGTDGSNSTSTHEPQVFALKSIQLDRISPLFLKELENEIDILRTMDHPNIVKAHEVYWASSSGGGSRSHHHNKQIYIVLDCCDGGDLYTRSPYSERQSARITANLTSAIKYMHDHGIVHRGECI
jgi:serine/threonine protein kinase